MKRLTARQHKIRLFAVEYVRDFNGTRAAEAAGYSAKRARQTGSELLDDPEVIAEIARVMRKREERSRVKAFMVLEELAVVAFSSIADYEFVKVGDDLKLQLRPEAHPDALRALAAVDYERRTIKLHPKAEALRMAGQHLGMYKEIIESRDLTLEELLLEDDSAGDDTA